MTKPDLYIGGRRLELAKRIGKGGEGEVYLLDGAEKKAVKVYTGAPNPDREAKVKAMVQHGLARSSTLVAFPGEIVTTRTGDFAGFSMRLVEGFREIHELYGPKSGRSTTRRLTSDFWCERRPMPPARLAKSTVCPASSAT